MDDGTVVRGETNITASKRRIVELMLEPATAHPLPETLEAIAQADVITLGPGSLYTSLIPNLLVSGVPEALAASRATKVFICNLMTQANESLGLSAKGGLMERAERVILLCIGLLFDSILVPILWVMLVLTAVTAVQRFIVVWKQAVAAPVVLERQAARRNRRFARRTARAHRRTELRRRRPRP